MKIKNDAKWEGGEWGGCNFLVQSIPQKYFVVRRLRKLNWWIDRGD